MRVKTTLIVAALAGLGMLSLPGFAAADVIRVSPGESIQAAVDQAAPGDKVKVAAGTYQESVHISTAGITLKGAGKHRTLIEPGTTPPDPGCEEVGICVAPNGPPGPPSLADVRVKDLGVSGFQFSGVFFFGAVDYRVTDVFATESGYGIAAFNSTGGRIWDNVTPANHEAGVYVGDSENADAIVKDNVADDNEGFGIFIRDASNGVVADNETSGNCIGILFLDTPGPPVNSNWVAHDNDASANTKVCPPEEGGPPAGGIGIAIAGAQNITLVGNKTNDNVPAGPVELSGGIVVVSIPGPTPEQTNTATGNVIKFNKAFGNSPFDILWDEQGDNTFTGNRCETSQPDGLCTSRGNGNGHGHGHGDDDDEDDDDRGHDGDGHHGDNGHGGRGKGHGHDD
jgi:parallel beta-helix repeat protein